MQPDGIIENISLVAEGERGPRRFREKQEGRHSDCFVYFLYGRGDYTENGAVSSVDSGDVIYLPRGSHYSMDILEQQKFIYVDFDFSDSADRAVTAYPAARLSGVEGMFRRMYSLYGRPGAAQRAGAMSELYAVLAALIRASADPDYLRESARQLAVSARELINERADDPDFSAGELHAELEVSEAQLRRIFRAAFGEPASVYLSECRIARAKALLASPFPSVAEVAKLSGFSDPCYFARAFRKLCGVAPSEYRRRLADGG